MTNAAQATCFALVSASLIFYMMSSAFFFIVSQRKLLPDPSSGAFISVGGIVHQRTIPTRETFNNELFKPRDVFDFRFPGCSTLHYGDEALDGSLNVSVIIIFHGENYKHLELTVRSVLYMTPAHLLADIVLVDDFNEQPLPQSICVLPKVKVLHNRKREGLIRSRAFGMIVGDSCLS
jgi:hypothetical protein